MMFAAASDGDVDHLIDAVLAHLESELAAAADVIRRNGRLMPGIPAILERLHAEAGVRQSVLTGNIAANAAVKLGAFGLERWLDLDIGAYGSDDADRLRLVPIALERLRQKHGDVVDGGAVWVIGDTPHDLACARAGGARCLLVATGRIAIDELERAGADVVLHDLGDVNRVIDVLLAS
jgi:phosphoglycolate phosphatase